MSVGILSHTQKASHCFHAVLYLRSLEVERPSVTALQVALYVASASLQMSGGTSARTWAMGRWC